MADNIMLKGRYVIGDILGQGKYSPVYEATDKDGNPFAIKSEEKTPKSRVLKNEAWIYRKIMAHSNLNLSGKYPRGIPKAYLFDENFCEHSVLVMDRLGETLADVVERREAPLSVSSVLMVGIQMLNRLEALHGVSIVHRDIKPDNILVGYGADKKTIYLSDFGLARVFMTHCGRHNPCAYGEAFSGLHPFAPSRSHKGTPQTQRDDLESLGYVMIHLATLKLPWSANVHKLGRRLTDEEMGDMKEGVTLDVLCKNLPYAFAIYMYYVKNLGFLEKPDYFYLRRVLQEDMYLEEETPVLDWL